MGATLANRISLHGDDGKDQGDSVAELMRELNGVKQEMLAKEERERQRETERTNGTIKV